MPATIFFLIGEAGSDDLSRVEFEFPSNISMVSAGELVTALIALLDPLLNGGIKKAGVSFDLTPAPGAAFLSNSFADLRDKARFAFNASGAAGIFTKIITLPAFDESYVIANSKDLDTTDPDVDAFIDAMISGIAVTAGTIQPVDSRDYDLIGLKYAIEL